MGYRVVRRTTFDGTGYVPQQSWYDDEEKETIHYDLELGSHLYATLDEAKEIIKRHKFNENPPEDQVVHEED